MTPETLQFIEERIRAAVKETVNGKIDTLKRTNDEGMAAINTKIAEHNSIHEADMKEIKPVIQFVSGTKMLGEIIKWIAGVALAWAAIRGFLTMK
jgi:hypothetical protein